MSDETEISETEGQDPAEEAALKRLEEQGDEAGALRLRLERAERALARERGTRRSIELGTYRADLVKEFDLPDGDLIAGKTKPEMRASAEKMAKLIAAAIEKKGLTAAATSTERKPGAEDFGNPPPLSTEAVSGDVPMAFPELLRKAQSGEMTRRQIIDDLQQHGGRPIVRKTIAGAARQRAEAAAAGEAKTA